MQTTNTSSAWATFSSFGNHDEWTFYKDSALLYPWVVSRDDVCHDLTSSLCHINSDLNEFGTLYHAW